METKDYGDISPEEARQLTPLTFSEASWKNLFGDTQAYDPSRVFYGTPGQTVKDGVIFDDVYYENGKRHGGIITGQPKQAQ